MPFCPACEHRPAHCMRRCERLARGEHLWNVVQDEMLRGHPENDRGHLTFARQSDDIRRAFVAGAEAIRSMPR